jgi:hypothetical protein
MTALTSSCMLLIRTFNVISTDSYRWIGRDTVPALLADVFGVEDRTQLKQGKFSLPILDNEYSERVRAGEFIYMFHTRCAILISTSR